MAEANKALLTTVGKIKAFNPECVPLYGLPINGSCLGHRHIL